MSTYLPIDEIKSSLLSALRSHHTLVLSAPPGAGKSTRLPLWLLAMTEFSGKKIYLLQPRRIAARNLASFLASQLNEPVGETVGYRLRNESKISSKTQLEVITEGILTQIIQNDAELSNCAMVVLDEFHERSLHADLAFALTRDVQQGLREDLKILLMSATLATGDILEQLPDAIALRSEGKCFPVQIDYLPCHEKHRHNAWRDHALKVIKQTLENHQGSVLVFLPGVADIRYLVTNLQDCLSDNMLLCPLYGELTMAEQQQAISPSPKGFNKLVLATNIAETSLTIDGVDLVIDCGLEKVAFYDGQTMTNRLQQQAICKASAVQRAGRAGRLMPGRCIRLYSREDFERRRENSVSEIKQTDLLPLLIEAARWGVTALAALPLLEHPVINKENLAWQELQQLRIVDDKKRLTAHGHRVAALPCHPRFAHMVITAQALEQQHKVKQLAEMACWLAALLGERDIYRSEQARQDSNILHRLDDLWRRNGRYLKVGKHIFQQVQQLARQLNIKYSREPAEQFPSTHIGSLLALA